MNDAGRGATSCLISERTCSDWPSKSSGDAMGRTGNGGSCASVTSTTAAVTTLSGSGDIDGSGSDTTVSGASEAASTVECSASGGECDNGDVDNDV